MTEGAASIKPIRMRIGEVLRSWLFPGWPRDDAAGVPRAAIERQLIYHASSGVASGSIIHVLLAMVFVWGIAQDSGNPALHLWLAAMVVAAGVRGGLCTVGVRRLDRDPAFAKAALVGPALLTGVTWAALAVLCYSGLGGPQDLFIIFVIGGVCLGSLAVSGAYLPAYYAFYLTAFPPLVAVVFLRGSGHMPVAMGLMLTVYFLAVLIYARRFSRTLVEQIIARMSEERMRAELAQTKEMLQAALESRRDSFAVFDEQDRLLFWNRPFARGLERHFGKLHAGVRFADLIRASARAGAAAAGVDPEEWVAARLAHHRNPGGAFEQQVDGRWILVQEYRTPRGHTVLVHTDISELKAREHALRDSEAEKAGILEAALDAVITVDGQGRILDFNAAAQRLFGWRAEEVVGRPLTKIVVPARYRPLIERAIRRFGETGRIPDLDRRFETRALTRGGEEIPVEVSIAHVRTAAGELFACFIRDMRAQKQAEEALKAARDAAESASRAKSEFLAMMSHEIRTPMNGILGALDLLAEMALEPQARHLVRIAQGAGESLRSLLDDLIDFSRIEAGRLVLERVPFDLPQLLAATAEIFRHQAEAKGLVLEVSLAEGLPEIVIADPARLRQVLFNLLSNAVKYTREGTVSLEACRRAGSEGFCVVDILVRDTGIGIAPEVLPRIFDKFTQAENARREGEGGMGLGLAISRSLVELMGGSITVESTPGHGSCFTIRIPFLVSAEGLIVREEAEEGEGRQPDLAGVHVLVVDDSATNRLVIAEMLRRADAVVLEAASAREGLALLARNRVDLVLMDIAMPEVDGFAALAAIREAGMTVPVVALTAHAGPEERERILKAGFLGHVAKPVARATLLRILSRLLDRWVEEEGGREREGVASAEAEREENRRPVAGDGGKPEGDRTPPLLIRRFWEELAQRAEAIQRAGACRDRRALALEAHALASAAAFVGETALAEGLRLLEARAEAEQTEEDLLKRSVAEALSLIAETRTHLLQTWSGLADDSPNPRKRKEDRPATGK